MSLLSTSALNTFVTHSKLAGKSSLQIADPSLVSVLTRDSPSDSVRPTFKDLKPVSSNGLPPHHPLRTPLGTVPSGLQNMTGEAPPPPPQRNELSALGE